jgi:hypothetical protein
MTGRRIPPSLKWLIINKARLEGEILKAGDYYPKRLETKAQEIQGIEESLVVARLEYQRVNAVADARMRELRADLDAVIAAMRLHEIEVDPDAIRPITTRDLPRLARRGVMTRLIFECLRLDFPLPSSTSQITVYLAERMGIAFDTEEFDRLRDSARRRMKTLVAQGRIQRHHRKVSVVEGRWSLPGGSLHTVDQWLAEGDAAEDWEEDDATPSAALQHDGCPDSNLATTGKAAPARPDAKSE